MLTITLSKEEMRSMVRISHMKLDDELKELIDLEVDTMGMKQFQK